MDFGVVSITTIYLLWEIISFVLLKKDFASLMDAKQMEYVAAFFSGAKVQ